MTTPTRRRFLRGSLALALATPVGAAMPRTRHGLAFGTRVRITVADQPAAQADAALDAAFAALREAESAAALHQRDGALWQLNQHGHIDWGDGAADRTLRPLLAQALRWAEATEGAFDPSIQPLWQAHFAAMAAGHALPAAARAQARALADWRGVRVDSRGAQLAREGMQLTLNGLAQGFAADRAWDALAAQGVRHALVDAGEWRAAGPAWRLGLRPGGTAIALRDAAVASSGMDGFRFSADGRLFHILDPRTGLSPPELAAAHVIAPDACTADALSTACMVLGRQRALALVRELPQVHACLIDRAGRTWTSAHWRDFE